MKPLEQMGQFKTVVVDPPWDVKGPVIGDKRIKSEPRNATWKKVLPYNLLDTNTIQKIPIDKVLAPDAFLFCWVINKYLPNVFNILAGWDCHYSFTMTWIKGGGPQLPNSPSFNAEWCVVGRKGKPEFTETKAFSTANCWPRGAHSEKPEGFYDLLRRVTPGPRLDVFGRRQIPGFTSWGDQAPQGEPLPGYCQGVLL